MARNRRGKQVLAAIVVESFFPLFLIFLIIFSFSLFLALNWKQKNFLKEEIIKEEKIKPILPFGTNETVQNLDKIFDGYKSIDITSLDEFDSRHYVVENAQEFHVPIRSIKTVKLRGKDRIRSPNYKIQTPLLFGSHKVGFFIERKNIRNERVKFGRGKT